MALQSLERAYAAMVRQLSVERDFPVSVREFKQLIYGDQGFKLAFHRSRGDRNVDVCEWIDCQRVCFYSMVEGGGSGEVTRVLERERFEWGAVGDGEERLVVHSSITPENPLGNVFKIEIEWKIEAHGPRKCTATAVGSVECTAKAWGLQRVAEGLLQSQSEQSLKQWLESGAKRIESFLQEEERESESDNETEKQQSLGVREESGGIRMRAPGDGGDGEKNPSRGGGDGDRKAKSSDEECEELDSFSVHVESNEELLRGLTVPCVRAGERSEEPDFPWIMLGWLLLISAVAAIFWCLNYKAML